MMFATPSRGSCSRVSFGPPPRVCQIGGPWPVSQLAPQRPFAGYGTRKRRGAGPAMYVIDKLDKVVELSDLPWSSVGAPCPVILAGEHCLSIAYFLQDTPADWDGTTIRVVGPDTPGEPAAIVRFVPPYASTFGPPNDEAFAGHPLAKKGRIHTAPSRCSTPPGSAPSRRLTLEQLQPFRTPHGRRRATFRAMPAFATTSTTRSTSL